MNKKCLECSNVVFTNGNESKDMLRFANKACIRTPILSYLKYSFIHVYRMVFHVDFVRISFMIRRVFFIVLFSNENFYNSGREEDARSIAYFPFGNYTYRNRQFEKKKTTTTKKRLNTWKTSEMKQSKNAHQHM